MTSSKENKEKEQKKVLTELETIKSLLVEDAPHEEIPVIDEMVFYDNPDEDQVLEEKDSTDLRFTSQKAKEELSSNKAGNPFLPDHIRNRISGNNEESNDHFLKAQSISKTLDNYQVELIDSLVAEFLPKIEVRLREKLLEMVQPPQNSTNQKLNG